MVLSKWYGICNKCYVNSRNYLHGTLSPNSNVGIGIITEDVVYKVLKDCEKCNTINNFHDKYDLISKKYGNIDVKSSTLRKMRAKNAYYWQFRIKNKNSNVDYYICIGFNKNKSEILKVWVIDSNSCLINKGGIFVSNSKQGLERVKEYEVDSYLYNKIYQNLDITTLSEFKLYYKYFESNRNVIQFTE